MACHVTAVCAAVANGLSVTDTSYDDHDVVVVVVVVLVSKVDSSESVTIHIDSSKLYI